MDFVVNVQRLQRQGWEEKYEITITTTLALPRGEGREGRRRKGRRWEEKEDVGLLEKMGRKKDVKIKEDKWEKREKTAWTLGEQYKGGPITFANSTRLALACIALPLGKSFAWLHEIGIELNI